MKRTSFLLVAFFLLNFARLQGQTILQVGDIGITGYDGDNPDAFSFVLLVDVVANTEISFTDNGWKASGSFRTTEQVLTWTAPTGGLMAGTVVVIDNGMVTEGGGSVSGSMPAFSVDGDQLFAYQGTLSNPTILAGLQMNGDWDADATNANTSAQPSAINGTGAFSLAVVPEKDNAVFVGTVTGTQAEIITALNTLSNWTTSNTRIADLSQGSFTLLPITLISFEGWYQGSSVLLTWRTALELENDYMSVERSADGWTYESIGRVPGQGTTYEEHSYTFVDE